MQPEKALDWEDALAELRAMQTELMRNAPYRDVGLVPRPGADEAMLLATERRIGQRLPASYRAFLLRYDGWPRFFDGASLLGTKDLGNPEHLKSTRPIFRAAASPSACAPPSYRAMAESLLVFGIDNQCTTLFAFDMDQLKLVSEPPVIAWVSELGLRFRSFSEFMAGLSQMCRAELELLGTKPTQRERRAPAAARPSSEHATQPILKSA